MAKNLKLFFLCYPHFGTLDNWLPVLNEINDLSGNLAFTLIIPNPAIIRSFHKDNAVVKITNNIFDIVLTSGAKNLEVIDDYASSLKLVEENIYEKKINDKIVRYVKNTSFNDLENLVRNSSFLITCEGGISHVSYNLDIETIAFYEKNRLQHMKFWTGHMKKLTLHERKDMKSLLEDANFFNKLKNKVENLV